MNEKDDSQSIDELLEQIETLDFSESEARGLSRGKGVTFWLTDDYKVKYELVQAKSNGKFHKLLKKVIKSAIDRAKISA